MGDSLFSFVEMVGWRSALPVRWTFAAPLFTYCFLHAGSLIVPFSSKRSRNCRHSTLLSFPVGLFHEKSSQTVLASSVRLSFGKVFIISFISANSRPSTVCPQNLSKYPDSIWSPAFRDNISLSYTGVQQECPELFSLFYNFFSLIHQKSINKPVMLPHQSIFIRTTPRW